MQLNLTTDYAIRLVLYLATVERAAGSTEISDSMCIPRGQFGSISKTLRERGIIETLRGTNGGFRLAKQPEEISLHEIVNAMEGITASTAVWTRTAIALAMACRIALFISFIPASSLNWIRHFKR